MDIVQSKDGVYIRLTYERWEHIITGHPEMKGIKEDVLDAIGNPDSIYDGKSGEYIAVKGFKDRKLLMVVYSEIEGGDGFIITAFLTSRVQRLEKMNKIWPQ